MTPDEWAEWERGRHTHDEEIEAFVRQMRSPCPGDPACICDMDPRDEYVPPPPRDRGIIGWEVDGHGAWSPVMRAPAPPVTDMRAPHTRPQIEGLDSPDTLEIDLADPRRGTTGKGA